MTSARSGDSKVYIIWRKPDGKYAISRVAKSVAREVLYKKIVTFVRDGEPEDWEPIAILKTLDIEIDKLRSTIDYGKLVFIRHK